MNSIDRTYDLDSILDQNDLEFDDICMPIPNIDNEPQLLISKVRKHYMDYLVKLLSINYENNHRLINKNVYLPSAIWKCAKVIETSAAQSCMVVQLYRTNILTVIKNLKKDTIKGKLNTKLSECLRKAPENDKKTQTLITPTDNCNCQCLCSKRKKRRRTPESTEIHVLNDNIVTSQPVSNVPPVYEKNVINTKAVPFITNNKCDVGLSPLPSRTSLESQDSDELMSQLQKLFYSDDNSQEDQLFEGGVYDVFENSAKENMAIKPKPIEPRTNQIPDSIIENHAAQIKSLDERLASLTGLLQQANSENNITTVTEKKLDVPKNATKAAPSKWMCEEYFNKSRLYEFLYGDINRKKLERIKQTIIELFGEESEEEDIMSPLDETPEFVISCKERIAPWVVKMLTPLYARGRIKDKSLFKSLTRHLLKIIYKCSKYPKHYEVYSFVADFMETHKVIRCEADFMKFEIQNL